ncbi:MAG TPA: hypothetical protein PKN28_00795 [Clostridiales bacterium]|nr:hypothetical protein [Clostridiales bacterium]
MPFAIYIFVYHGEVLIASDEAPLLRAMTSNRREREKAEAPPVADEARLSSEINKEYCEATRARRLCF